MSDIFADKNIYPHKGKIKSHFGGFYDTVFIAFLPFFKVNGQASDKSNYKKSSQISLEEVKKRYPTLKDTPRFGVEFFSYIDTDYPTDKEVFETGEVVGWNKVVKGTGFVDCSELNKALRTSIGALRQVFRRPELVEELNVYTGSQKIWHPTEGCFDVLSKMAIYKSFKLLGKNQIVVADEFYETSLTLNLNEVTDFEFSEKVAGLDRYLYSVDREVLFMIDWDSFFFLIATDQDKLKKINEECLFEGFFCNDDTQHDWDYNDGEVQELLHIEETQKSLTSQLNPKNLDADSGSKKYNN